MHNVDRKCPSNQITSTRNKSDYGINTYFAFSTWDSDSLIQIVTESLQTQQFFFIEFLLFVIHIRLFFGHSEAIHIETRAKITVEKVRELLAAAPGITVMDERVEGGYPTAVTESSGHDDVFVGRIREDISYEKGIDLWVVADNVRKGAALNSVQIAEELVKNYI